MLYKRLSKELLYLKGQFQKETNIFYFPNDDITRGSSIMFGPKDTPYEFCPMEYDIFIQYDYPFSHPKLLYKTNDGRTRFHPNFYVDGKVCLSILGTYSGPKWASSMNISTVLMSIYSLMTENPLIHEPAYENTSITNPKNSQYSQYVEHQMIKLFIENMENNYYTKFAEQDPIFKEELYKNYELIKEKVKQKATTPEIIYTILPYSMQGQTYWRRLAEKLLKITKK